MPGCHVQPDQQWNLIFGYNAPYLEQKINLAALAGDNFLVGTVVPAGEAWVVSGLSGINWTRVITRISGGIYDGAVYYSFFAKASPAIGEAVFCSVPLVVSAGNYVYCYYQGCTAGDDIYFNAAGYKMKLTQ